MWRRSVQAQSGPNWTRPTITTICSDVLLSDAALHRWAEGEETGRGMVVFTLLSVFENTDLGIMYRLLE